MKHALLLFTILATGLVPVAQSHAQTPTAVIIPNGYTQFLDANGKPLSNGTVNLYVPNTTTPKTTWQDPYQSIVNPNPIILNAAGEALIWGSGIYRQVVYDVNNNLIWDQLTGGYNCVGGGAIPMGANGALQYNNNGIFGGLPLGTTGQVLLANSTGPPTWGAVPVGSIPISALTGLGSGVAAALALPLDGTGALCAETGCTLNNPTINNPTISGGTWNNPTFSGTITGLPGGTAVCHTDTGAVATYCVGSNDIIEMEAVLGTPPTGASINAFTTSTFYAWNVYETPALAAAAASSIAAVPHLQAEIEQLAAHDNVKLK